jgi:hypothetical protein
MPIPPAVRAGFGSAEVRCPAGRSRRAGCRLGAAIGRSGAATEAGGRRYRRSRPRAARGATDPRRGAVRTGRGWRGGSVAVVGLGVRASMEHRGSVASTRRCQTSGVEKRRSHGQRERLCCIERSLAILTEDPPAGDASRPLTAAFSASRSPLLTPPDPVPGTDRPKILRSRSRGNAQCNRAPRTTTGGRAALRDRRAERVSSRPPVPAEPVGIRRAR